MPALGIRDTRMGESVSFRTDSISAILLICAMAPNFETCCCTGTKMDCFAKLRLGMVLGVATASSVAVALVFGPLCAPVSAQVSSHVPGQLSVRNSGADKSTNYASPLGAREIMEKSVAATERSWEARDQFTYTELDDDRRLDSQGNVKSQNVDFTKMILVNGARFDQLVQHNGQAPSAADQREINENLENLKHETPAERSTRIGKDQENRAFLGELLAGFDFSLAGEELVGARPAFVIQVSPHPGYHATGKYAKVFNKVEGKIWIDKQDFNWIKLDGEITQPFSMGLFIARVQSGSHVVLEQICVGDAVWVPRRLEVQGTATIFFFKTLGIDRILTYSDYLPSMDSAYSVSK